MTSDNVRRYCRPARTYYYLNAQRALGETAWLVKLGHRQPRYRVCQLSYCKVGATRAPAICTQKYCLYESRFIIIIILFARVKLCVD